MTVDIVVPIAFFMTVIILAIGIPLVRAIIRRSDSQARLTAVHPDTDARLARIEASVEAIAIEVERISEGQRFTTRLLSARPEAVPAQAGPAGRAEPAGASRTAVRDEVG